jgi:hypothetical protein
MWGLEKIVENMNKENSERIPIIRGWKKYLENFGM